MKILMFLFAFSALTSNSYAATSDMECIGDLDKDLLSRRVHLTMSEDQSELFGYRGSIDTGGIFFRAKEMDGQVLLSISQDLGDREKPIANATIPITSRDFTIKENLEDGYEVILTCYYF